MSVHIVTSLVLGSSTRAPYISLPAGVSVRPKKLRRRLKLAYGLAEVPYYIEACLLRSSYFVTLAALLTRIEQITS